MSRLLTYGNNIKRVAQSIFTKEKRSSHSEVRTYGTLVTVGLRLPQNRLHLHCRFPVRGNASLSVQRHSHFGTSITRSFSIISASSAVTHHAQAAWKRLSQKYYSQRCASSGGTFYPLRKIAFNPARRVPFYPVRMIAQAVSLSLTRSHLLVPGIFGFTCGKQAWAQRSLVGTDHYPSKNTLYMQAQDGRDFVSSLVFSAFEGVVLLLRALYLSILFSPSIMMAPFADCFGVQYRKMWLRIVHRTLEKAGPAFIKWGQWAATRPDLFPKDLCTKLSELHTKAPEHSFSYTKKNH